MQLYPQSTVMTGHSTAEFMVVSQGITGLHAPPSVVDIHCNNAGASMTMTNDGESSLANTISSNTFNRLPPQLQRSYDSMESGGNILLQPSHSAALHHHHHQNSESQQEQYNPFTMTESGSCGLITTTRL